MKILLRVLLFFLLIFVPAIGQAAYTCDTLDNDGVTNNKSALDTCLSNAALESDKTLNITSSGAGSYYWDPAAEPAEGVRVYGADTLLTDVKGGFKIVNNDVWIVGIEFLEGPSRPIEINDQDSAPVTGIHIRDCKFTYSGGYAVITAWNMNNSFIDNNEIDNNSWDVDAYVADNIELQAGDSNFVGNNVIDGGETGIIFKYTHANNGPDKTGFYKNIVMDNTITNVSEEFLSFDMSLNSAASVPHRESDSVSAISSNIITLGDAGWDDGTVDYTGYYMSVLNNNDDDANSGTGEYRLIDSHTGDDFTLESAITGLEVSDWVTIGALAIENYVAFNSCSGMGFPRSCPLFYGNSFYNRIEENSSNGIRVNTANNHHQATGNETGNCGRGPSGYNVVRGNTITTYYDGTGCTDGSYPLNCRLQTYERDFGTCSDSFVDEVLTVGDVAVDNTVGNLLGWTDVDGYYLSNNTYDTLDTTNSSDAGSTSLDTTDWTCTEYGMYCVDSSETIALVADLNDTCSGASICSAYNSGPAGPEETAGKASFNPSSGTGNININSSGTGKFTY